MEWKDYEEVTKHIYETLGKNNGVEIECFGNKCSVKGKSEVNHQIDVLTKHSDGIHTYKTAIECKYWDKNINKDIRSLLLLIAVVDAATNIIRLVVTNILPSILLIRGFDDDDDDDDLSLSW